MLLRNGMTTVVAGRAVKIEDIGRNGILISEGEDLIRSVKFIHFIILIESLGFLS